MGRCVVVYADGGSRGNPGPSAIGVEILDDSGKVLHQISKKIGHATNNEAEYLALITGLEAAVGLGAQEVAVRMDSELLVRQVNGLYRVRSPGLQPLHQRVMTQKARFARFSIEHVRRDGNRRADALVNRALDESRIDQ
ncbi:MAG: ribonuclease HI family protein [Dehalococcoidia bacterium]|nr:ribonuclease HI family protein [Dehalococcoidia bacterium]